MRLKKVNLFGSRHGANRRATVAVVLSSSSSSSSSSFRHSRGLKGPGVHPAWSLSGSD